MRVIRHAVRSLLLIAAIVFSHTSFADFAQFPDDAPRWACWYSSEQLSVQCLLTKTPTQGQELRAAEVASRIDSRLPKLVQLIWGSPEELADAYISIPLMNVPFDMDFVSLLAKSVMCGTRKDCSIHFDRNADGLAAVRAATVAAGASEAEVMAVVAAQGMRLARLEAETVAPARKKRPRI
ncbi:MAG: hypothetical protein CVU34_17155 [Betaproteobacteria bacterium HGW-Betaproteobacteria-7]|jgi:hypothetical protein|nr:MAG: hypothetical protein CVU34_17155 [Betaproteobacteria bacterium HGW-Betaproteobacteria-7]